MGDKEHPNIFVNERFEIYFFEEDGSCVRVFRAGYKGKYYVIYEQGMIALFDVVDRQYFKDKHNFDINDILPKDL